MQFTLLDNKKILTHAVLLSSVILSQNVNAFDVTTVTNVNGGAHQTITPGFNPYNVKSTGAVIGNSPLLNVNAANSVVTIEPTVVNGGFGMLSTGSQVITSTNVANASSITIQSNAKIQNANVNNSPMIIIKATNFTLTNNGTIDNVAATQPIIFTDSANSAITNSGTIQSVGLTAGISAISLAVGSTGNVVLQATSKINVADLGATAYVIRADGNMTIANLGTITVSGAQDTSSVFYTNLVPYTLFNEASGVVTTTRGSVYEMSAGTPGNFTLNNKGSMIRTDASAKASSAVLYNTIMSGNILNSGTITNADISGFGLKIQSVGAATTLNQTGTITGATGIYISTTAMGGVTLGTGSKVTGVLADGLQINNTIGAATYSITNAGTITGAQYGIQLLSANVGFTLTGDINNSSTITGTTKSAIGINVGLVGNISNSGTLATGSTVTTPIIEMTTAAITGNITNSPTGIIKALNTNQDALSITFAGTVPNAIVNQGTLSSVSGRAIFSNKLLAAGITNTGNISTTSGAYAIHLEDAGTTALNHNGGTITGNIVMGAGSVFTMGTGTLNEKLQFTGALTRKNAAGANTFNIKGGTASNGTNNIMTGSVLGTTTFTLSDSVVVGNLLGANAGDAFNINGASLTGNITGTKGAEILTVDTGIADPTTGSSITGIIKDVGSLVIVKGSHDFKGDISVVGAITQGTSNTTTNFPESVIVDGVITAGTKITLAKNAQLDVSKNITVPTFENKGGILKLLAPITLTGNYIQTIEPNPLPDIPSKGAIKIALSPTSSGTMNVIGSANVAGEFIVDFSSSTYIANNQKIDVLTATSLTDNATTVKVVNSPIVSFAKDLAPQPGKISIVATRTTTYDQYATSPEAKQIGAILEQLGQNGVTGDAAILLGKLDSIQSKAEFDLALLQIGPDVNGSLPVESISNQNNFIRAVGTRLDIVRAQDLYDDSGYGYGYSAGDWFSGQSTWVQAYSNFARQEKRNGVNGYTANTAGVAIGSDALADDALRMGLSLGLGTDKIKTNSPKINKLDIDTASLSVYGSVIGYGAYIDWQILGSRNWYKGKRNILIGTLNYDLMSRYKAWQFGAKAEGGISFYQGALEITPIVSGYVSYTTIEKYTETGATGINLSVQSQGYNYLEGSAGIKWAYPIEFTTGLFVPEFRAMYRQEIVNDMQKIHASYAQGGPVFTVNGYSPAKKGMDFSGSAAFFADNNYSLRFTYQHFSKASYRNNAYILTFRREFFS